MAKAVSKPAPKKAAPGKPAPAKAPATKAPAKKAPAPAPKAAAATPKRKFVTKRIVAGGNNVYRKWNEWAEGDTVVGKYVDSKVDKYGKTNRTLEVIEATFADGTSDDYNGKRLTLNANGLLNYAFGSIEMGEIVQVVYNGMQELTSGNFAGKDSHNISVDVVTEEGSEEEESYDAESQDEEEGNDWQEEDSEEFSDDDFSDDDEEEDEL